MTTKEYINEAEESLLHTYNRYQIVLEKGDGVYLYDTDGKKYLDFASGIAVFAFGYNNKEYNDGLKSQIDKLIHTSNLFYNVPASTAACRLKKLSGMDRVFFTNSGTEAIEGAVKTVRKYGFNKDGRNDHEIIAMKNSFHGRSMGSLSVTGNAHYQDPFKPLIGGVKFAEFNNLESVKELITDRTCGIILEPVQGEGGVFPGDEEFIKGIRKLCDENDILLVFDEIQCGMGRTGKMFAHEYYGVKPDVLTLAKALGCGFPVGAFLTNEKAAVLLPGDHGTTYGGNPLACAAVNKVLDLFENTDVLSNVNNVSTYLDEKLQNLVDDFDFVKSYRGKGLLKGLVIDESVKVNEIILKALDEGLIVISASGNVLRMVPSLVITRENIDEMYEKLNNVLKTFN